jgi:hypothetical protein
VFRSIIADKRIFKLDDGQLSESDTRSKFIDPLFKEVLGWHESEIRRESPVSKGYVDYVLGSDYSYLLIEAKRAKPRFQLSAPSKPRRLILSGPHLLGNRKIKPFIEQAQGYASDMGVQFCLVANGPQVIIFRPYLPGRPWRQGPAIVFHDFKDIEDHFAEFYGLLARDSVIAGSLTEAFEHLERTTTRLYTALDYLPDPDRELVRNRVWQQIARIMGPLLTDTAEDPDAQLEVIEHCYVTTPLGDETDQSLDALLRDAPTQYLMDARFVDLKPGLAGKTAFSHRMEADVHSARRGAFILTGGVGSGKTTFLRRFANIVDRDFVERFTVWLHIDFLPIGNVRQNEIELELRAFVYQRIREQVNQRFPQLFGTGAQIRALFNEEIKQAERTRLYGLDEGSLEWNRAVNALVDELDRSDEFTVRAALRSMRRNGRRIAVVLDNTDQLGENFQESVFLLAQKLSSDYEALCVVTLREEKFFAAYRRGIFDAFGDRRFHIGSPDLRQVLRKRLEYGRTKFAILSKADGGEEPSVEDIKQIDRFLRAMITSTTGRNANIVRMLASVSNGDMRHALDMFRDFLSSGNTNVDKIIEIVAKSGSYSVPFHEFAKSAILGSRKYYRSSVSHIVNLFKQSDALGASHLTACRILTRLAAAEGAASPHGQGYIAVPTLLREYRQSFGYADDFVQWAGELLRRNLLESEPPRIGDIQRADAIRITAAGAYYWRYLVRSFAYLDLVFVDTPISDLPTVKRLEKMAEMTDMTVRFERVRVFLEYLQRKEQEDLAISAERAGPFQEPLIEQIRRQIEAEIKHISKKVGVKDVHGAQEMSRRASNVELKQPIRRAVRSRKR